MSDKYKLSFTTELGCFHLKDTNHIYDVRKEIFTIKEGDPTIAKVTIQYISEKVMTHVQNNVN